MHSSETTNAKLGELLAQLETLISWAEADAEHAAEHDAPATAKDDQRRARNLRAAAALIAASYR